MGRNTFILHKALLKVKRSFCILAAMCISAFASAQVTLIDPNGVGGFEAGTTFEDNGWIAVNATNGNRSWYIGAAQPGYTGQQAAFIGNSNTAVGTAGGARTVHLYRPVTVPAGAENIQLKFKYKQEVSDVEGDEIFDYIAVYVTTETPVNAYLPLGQPVFGPYPGEGVPAFTQQEVTLPDAIAGTTTNLIFTFKADNNEPAAYGAIDDVELTYTMPACTGPSGFTVNATSGAASLWWIAAPTFPSNGYQYAVTATDTPPAVWTSTNATTGAAASLDPNTTYYAWVRSDCGGDLGSWRMIEFTTLCVAATVPYIEDFESVTVPAMPECTTLQNAGAGNNWVTDVPDDGGFATNSLVYQYNADEPANAWFFTRALSLTAGTSYRLSYSYGVASATFPEKMKIKLGMQADASAMAVELADYPEMDNAAEPIVNYVDFTPAVTGIYYIGFNAYSEADMFAIYVDDISVNLSPTCLEPASLSVSSTSNTATLTWPASAGTPSGYDFSVTDTNTAPSTFDNTTALTGQAGNLTANTQYFAWVRSNCGAGDTSEWVMTAFTTPCEAANVPYVLDFEDVTTPALPVCTTNENVGNGSNWATEFPDDYGFDTNVLMYEYDSDFAANTWFITNGVNLTAGTTYRIAYDYGNAGGTDYPEKMKVAYGMTSAAAGMTSLLADHDNIVNDVAPVNNEVGFTPATSGVYYFGFNAYSEADQFYLFIDNIVIDAVLAAKPFNTAGFSYYPNPVKNVLNLQYTSDITWVEVYNLLGQQVLAQQVNAARATVDMSAFTDGHYIVKVASGESIKTIKVFKRH